MNKSGACWINDSLSWLPLNWVSTMVCLDCSATSLEACIILLFLERSAGCFSVMNKSGAVWINDSLSWLPLNWVSKSVFVEVSAISLESWTILLFLERGVGYCSLMNKLGAFWVNDFLSWLQLNCVSTPVFLVVATASCEAWTILLFLEISASCYSLMNKSGAFWVNNSLSWYRWVESARRSFLIFLLLVLDLGQYYYFLREMQAVVRLWIIRDYFE